MKNNNILLPSTLVFSIACGAENPTTNRAEDPTPNRAERLLADGRTYMANVEHRCLEVIEGGERFLITNGPRVDFDMGRENGANIEFCSCRVDPDLPDGRSRGRCTYIEQKRGERRVLHFGEIDSNNPTNFHFEDPNKIAGTLIYGPWGDSSTYRGPRFQFLGEREKGICRFGEGGISPTPLSEGLPEASFEDCRLLQEEMMNRTRKLVLAGIEKPIVSCFRYNDPASLDRQLENIPCPPSP